MECRDIRIVKRNNTSTRISPARKNMLHNRDLNQSSSFPTDVLDFYNTAPFGYHSLDEKGVITHINTRGLSWLGLERREAIGNPFSRFLSEKSRERFTNSLAALTQPGSTATLELQIIPKNGIPRPILLHAAMAAGSGAIAIHCTLVDISSLRKQDPMIASETRYRRLFESAQEGILILDSESGKIIDANPYFTNLLGYPPQELFGKRLWEIGIFRDFIESQEAISEFETKDGQKIEVEFVSNVYTIDNTQVIHCTIRDITKRKEMERTLSEKEKDYRTLVNSTSVGVYKVTLDGRFLYANDNLAAMLECSLTELIEKNSSLRYQNPRDRQHFIKKLMKGGEVTNYEVQALTEKGNPRLFLINAALKGNEISGVIFDVTERKRVEDALKRSEERYKLAQRAANICSWDWDLKSGKLEWSESIESMLGFSRGRFKATYESYLECVHPEDRKHVVDSIRACIHGGKEYKIEHRIVWPDGSIHWVLKTGDVVRSKSGKALRMLGIIQDTTERKNQEERIKSSLKEKEVLLREVHHRVTNSLQVISSLLNLQAGYTKDENTLKALKESQNRIRSMALVHEKLYQSKDISNVDFSNYIKKLVGDLFLSYGVDTNRISIALDLHKTTLSIDKIITCGLLITELVSNSLKYAFSDRENGEIAILLHSQPGRSLALIVRDNGRGLPKNLDFHHTPSLGLQLVVALTSQLEGTIIREELPGTSFRITFPL